MKRSIKSVLNQTYKNFELIVVDDCSTDETQEVINSFHDSRIRTIKHEHNKGVHISRNDGIKNAEGKFVAFLDDDDEWLSKKLENQVNLIKNDGENYGLIYSGYYQALNGKIVKKILPKYKGDVHKIIINRNILSCLTAFVRKECFEKVGYFEYMPAVEDWDMWIRISEFYKFDYLYEPLAIYHVHSEQVSVNVERLLIGHKIILLKYWKKWKEKPKYLINHINAIGRLYLHLNRKKESKKWFVYSLKVKFFQKSFFLDLLVSRLLIRYFPHVFNPSKSTKNIIRITLDYLKKKVLSNF